MQPFSPWRCLRVAVTLSLLSLIASQTAWAAISNGGAHDGLTLRFATEPSTGSMILATVLVLAVRRRNRRSRFSRRR